MNLLRHLLSSLVAVSAVSLCSVSLWAVQAGQPQEAEQDPAPRMHVLGQELMENTTSFEEAVFKLLAVEASVEELEWLVSVNTPLTAWARLNLDQWQEMSNDTLLALGPELTVWSELGIDWQAYFTAMFKFSAMPEFAVEGNFKLDDIAAKIEELSGVRDKGESTEEELAALNKLIGLLQTLHDGMKAYPQSNRDLYLEREEQITNAISRMLDGRPLDPVPPVAIDLPEWELRVLSSGEWTKSSQADVSDLIYTFEDRNANLSVNSNAWVEGVKLDDEFMQALEKNIIASNVGSKLLKSVQWDEGELSFGSIGYVMATGVHGATLIVVHGDRLIALSFNCLDSDWALLAPVYDELVKNVQVGPQPAPVLANRAEFNYQLRADEPWILKSEGGESVDSVIEYGDTGVSVNVAVTNADGLEVIEDWILDMVREQLAAGYEDLELLQQVIVEHLGKSSGTTEFIATVGIEGSDVDPVKVHVKQLLTLHDGRIYFITATAPADGWAERAEDIEKVLQEMLFL